MPAQNPPNSFSTPAETADRVVAQFGEKPQVITLGPDDWVGTDDVLEFLRISEEMKDSAKHAQLVFR
jgi:hypothetical protein